MRHPWNTYAFPLVASGELDLDHARADAQAAVHTLWRADPAGRFFGFLKRRDGGPVQGYAGHAVTIEDTSEARPFGMRSQMWEWHRQVTHDPAPFEFVALFDRTRSEWPGPFIAHGDHRSRLPDMPGQTA